MSPGQTLVAIAATSAGLLAIVFEYVSAKDGALVLTGVAGAVTVGFAVLLFAGVLPRAEARAGAGGRSAETALVTSTVGFLSIASAWTGLPFVLGIGGAMLGSAAHRGAVQPRQRGYAALAVAIGVSAALLGCVAVIAL
jgi:hypothetical protein